MADIWDYFKNLFKKAEESSPSQPLIHEMISRTPEEKEGFERWKQSLMCRRMLGWLSDQYAVFKVAPDDIDEALDFLDVPSSKGFVVHFYKTHYNRQEVTHLFDYLKEKVRSLDYRTQISDTRTYNRANWVETVERHYLKPKPNRDEDGLFRQKFGNVTIELLLRDDKVHNLKFRATHYKDHLFAEVEDFNQLMQGILI